MSRAAPGGIDRRTLLTFAPAALAPSAFAAGAPADPGPKLAPKREVVERLAALKANQAVRLGKADVVGDFNDTAQKYDLHKGGPTGRDLRRVAGTGSGTGRQRVARQQLADARHLTARPR